jgi:hypothetical protein
MIDKAGCYRCRMLGWTDGASGNLLCPLLALKPGEPGNAYRLGYKAGCDARTSAHESAAQAYNMRTP